MEGRGGAERGGRSLAGSAASSTTGTKVNIDVIRVVNRPLLGLRVSHLIQEYQSTVYSHEIGHTEVIYLTVQDFPETPFNKPLKALTRHDQHLIDDLTYDLTIRVKLSALQMVYSHSSRSISPINRQSHRSIQLHHEAHPAHNQHHHNTSSSPHNGSPRPPSLVHRRATRSNTAKTYRPPRVDWHPGQEPGIDTSTPDGGQHRTQLHNLHQDCDITVVDFSEAKMKMRHLTNATLGGYLNEERPEWVRCRWINVNGLSWDVIKLLGSHKGFHRLAIEDLTNTNNRTKADWWV